MAADSYSHSQLTTYSKHYRGIDLAMGSLCQSRVQSMSFEATRTCQKNERWARWRLRLEDHHNQLLASGVVTDYLLGSGRRSGKEPSEG